MPGAFGAADPLFLLLAALAAEAYFGGVAWSRRTGSGAGLWPWPRRRFVELLRGLQARLDRPGRSAKALTVRGACLAGLTLAAALAAGALLGLFTRHYPFAWAVELLLLFAALRLRRSHRSAQLILADLEREAPEAARERLARLAAPDLSPGLLERLPRAGLAVTALTALERRFVDAAVAPALWFALLGLPGLLGWMAAQRTALTLDGPAVAEPGALGSRAFGRPAGLLLAALRWPPRQAAALLLLVVRRLRSAGPPVSPERALAESLDRVLFAGLLLGLLVAGAIVARLLLRQG